MTRVREVDADLWALALQAAEFVPLQQSPAYGAALARRGREPRRLRVEDDGGRIACGVQASTRRFAGLRLFTAALRGPVAFAGGRDAIAPAPLTAAIRALRRPWPHALVVAPELADGASATEALRGCGLRRVMTPASSIEVPLGGDAATLRARLAGKWRNRLARAERSGLRADIARGGASLSWLAGAHGRMMKARGFRGLPADFVMDLAAASARRDVFLCVAEMKRQTVAAALFLRHGPTATYVVAAAEPEGRAAHAGTLLAWRGLLALQEAGATRADLGQVDTERSAGLARFKLGRGGEVFVPCGTWTPSPL
ncbi:MAG: GNAT family N-acetyltransferase [Alphaproteobacteria bacterium]